MQKSDLFLTNKYTVSEIKMRQKGKLNRKKERSR